MTVSSNFFLFYFWNEPCIPSLLIFLKREGEQAILHNTEIWFCGPNGSWCITEMASPPEGMTHRRMETQVTHTYIHTQAHTPIYRHTQAGLWQTVGSFLWLQNIRSWPWPKSYSYYQCGSEDTLLLFILWQVDDFLLWDPFFIFCILFLNKCFLFCVLLSLSNFSLVWEHVCPSAESSSAYSVLECIDVFLHVTVCFCRAAVHSASVVRVVIQWWKLACPLVDPCRAVPPTPPPARLLLCSAPPSASPRLLLANSDHLIKGLVGLMVVSVPPHAGSYH